MNFKTNAFALIITTVFAVAAMAQAPDLPLPEGPVVAAKAGVIGMQVNSMDVEPAKGAPFCATITTEHTQLFADGNRIHSTDNSTLCRDGEGRTRREASLNLMGAAPEKFLPKLITISDPVAGVRYVLDPDNKVARKMPLLGPKLATVRAGGLPAGGDHLMVYQKIGTAESGGGDVLFKQAGRASDGPAPTTESLGDQTIEGIRATGTRITTTIPAGKMGNDQPILVTSERWYSADLKTTVMTKHVDPWSGELKTQFTNVNTGEPDASLFAVPGDYKVVDEKLEPMTIRVRPPTTPE